MYLKEQKERKEYREQLHESEKRRSSCYRVVFRRLINDLRASPFPFVTDYQRWTGRNGALHEISSRALKKKNYTDYIWV